MIYIGIDGGPGGGIVGLSPIKGLAPIFAMPMPVKTTGKLKLVDGRALTIMLRAMPWPADGLHIAIEDLPHHSRDKAAMRSMALNFGRLTGALEARLPADSLIRMELVPAGNSLQSWQRRMLGTKPGDTKAAALAAATRLWPEMNWIQPRCRTPHDGIIDAALIAEDARRRFETA